LENKLLVLRESPWWRVHITEFLKLPGAKAPCKLVWD